MSLSTLQLCRCPHCSFVVVHTAALSLSTLQLFAFLTLPFATLQLCLLPHCSFAFCHTAALPFATLQLCPLPHCSFVVFHIAAFCLFSVDICHTAALPFATLPVFVFIPHCRFVVSTLRCLPFHTFSFALCPIAVLSLAILRFGLFTTLQLCHLPFAILQPGKPTLTTFGTLQFTILQLSYFIDIIIFTTFQFSLRPEITVPVDWA